MLFGCLALLALDADVPPPGAQTREHGQLVRVPPIYAEAAEPAGLNAFYLLQSLIGLAPTSRVLQLGCGPGGHGRHLVLYLDAQRGGGYMYMYMYMCIEPIHAQDSVKWATEKVHAIIPHAKYTSGDLASHIHKALEFQADTLLVTEEAVKRVNFAADKQLKLWSRVLPPGGRVLGAFYNSPEATRRCQALELPAGLRGWAGRGRGRGQRRRRPLGLTQDNEGDGLGMWVSLPVAV